MVWHPDDAHQPASPLPPGWYADPEGQHWMRYWDGHRWTSEVLDASDLGATSWDVRHGMPLPYQRDPFADVGEFGDAVTLVWATHEPAVTAAPHRRLEVRAPATVAVGEVAELILRVALTDATTGEGVFQAPDRPVDARLHVHAPGFAVLQKPDIVPVVPGEDGEWHLLALRALSPGVQEVFLTLLVDGRQATEVALTITAGATPTRATAPSPAGPPTSPPPPGRRPW